MNIVVFCSTEYMQKNNRNLDIWVKLQLGLRLNFNFSLRLKSRIRHKLRLVCVKWDYREPRVRWFLKLTAKTQKKLQLYTNPQLSRHLLCPRIVILQWFVKSFSGLSCPAADLLIIQSLAIQSFSLLRTDEANLVIESSMGHNGLVCCLESVSFLEVLLL